MANGYGAAERSIFVVGSFVAACSVKVERLPQAGETMRAQSFTIEAGGKGFNVATAAHRLGAKVEGVLAVGSDPFANFARTSLALVGLPATMLVTFPGATGAGVGFVDAAGENCIAVCPAANDLLSEHDIDAAADALQRASVIVAQFEVGDAPIIAAFAAGGEIGGTRILNPSPFRPIAPDILSRTDILVVNETEAAALATMMNLLPALPGTRPELAWGSLAVAVLQQGIKVVIVTLGAGGAIAWSAHARLFQPAFAVQAIDTIGAGDAFLGALCASLWRDEPLDQAMRAAAACGAIVTTCIGLLCALPSCEILDEFLSRDPA